MGSRKNVKLTDRVVQQAKDPGLHADGGGLFLNVAEGGSKSWVYRYNAAPKPGNKWATQRCMGLGGYPGLSLDGAREKALELRLMRKKGIDPFEYREQERVAKEIEAAKARTFMDVADEYIDVQAKRWRYARSKPTWHNRLKTYAAPVFGDTPIAEIDTALIRQVVEPIWHTKNRTASRVLGYIEAIIDYAKVNQIYEGENPARWKGHFAKILGKRKVGAVKHCAALPYWQIPQFMRVLRATDGDRARRLEMVILTAVRTNELTGARWSEFNLVDSGDAGIWEIPASRMLKGNGETPHRVPLVGRALEIVKAMPRDREFVFYAKQPRKRQTLDPNNFLKKLGDWRDRTGREVTVHGMRSTFRDWAAEQTSFAREVCEAALSHATGNEVALAYQRGDLFEKRKNLMIAWDEFCASPELHKVVPFRAA